MTPVSDEGRAFLDALFAAIEARPDGRRSFCIQRFTNAPPIVIHKGLVGGRMGITDGVLDEMVGAGLLRKVEPTDPRDCLYVLAETATSYRASRKAKARMLAGAAPRVRSSAARSSCSRRSPASLHGPISTSDERSRGACERAEGTLRAATTLTAVLWTPTGDLAHESGRLAHVPALGSAAPAPNCSVRPVGHGC